MSGCIPGSRHRCLFSVTTEWICFQNCPKVSLNAETQSRTVVTGLAAFYLVSRLQNHSLPTFLQGDWAVRCSHVFMLYLAFPYNEHQVRKTIQVSQFRRMLAWIRLTNQKLDITSQSDVTQRCPLALFSGCSWWNCARSYMRSPYDTLTSTKHEESKENVN